jgi:3-hydroxyacyl-[acyl-carrier-protein] dehydratase
MRNIFTDIQKTPEGIHGFIYLHADHPCFDGHFPGHKIFPAVAQLDLVLDLLSQALGRDFSISSIQKAKFPAPIAAANSVQIQIKWQTESLIWTIHSQNILCSTGTLVCQ